MQVCYVLSDDVILSDFREEMHSMGYMPIRVAFNPIINMWEMNAGDRAIAAKLIDPDLIDDQQFPMFTLNSTIYVNGKMEAIRWVLKGMTVLTRSDHMIYRIAMSVTPYEVMESAWSTYSGEWLTPRN